MIDATVSAFDPAVGDDELPRRQELGEDPVLRRRIGGGAEADDRVREERMESMNIIAQPATLMTLVMNITRPFGIESANAPTNQAKRRTRRRRTAWAAAPSTAARRASAGGDDDDPQHIVGERAEELRRHDGVEAAFHARGADVAGRRPAKTKDARGASRPPRPRPPFDSRWGRESCSV